MGMLPRLRRTRQGQDAEDNVLLSGVRGVAEAADQETAFSLNAWYVLHTRRQHEKLAARSLDARGIETYLPVREERRQWSDRVKLIERPLFPNYVFAVFNMYRKIDVLSTKGVVKILGTYRGPSAVPETQIEAVRTLVASNIKYDPYPFLVEGKPVCVKRGPMKGHVGVLSEKKRSHRFFITLPLLGQSVMVEIDAADLEAC